MSISVFRLFLTFSGVGVVGTAVQYLLLVLSVQYAGASPVAGSSMGYVCGAVVNYFLNYYVTFKSRKAHKHAMPRFFFIAAIGLGFNALIMAAATESLKMHYLIGQVLATGMVLLWNFFANRFWTFRH